MRWFGRAERPSLISLADRARNAGMWDVAAARYKIALDRDPRNWPIWVQYGHALKESGQLADAEAAYRRAIAYRPREADTQLQLGHVLKLLGRRDEAQAAYIRACAIDPSLPYPPEELAGLGWSRAEVAELLRQLRAQHRAMDEPTPDAPIPNSTLSHALAIPNHPSPHRRTAPSDRAVVPGYFSVAAESVPVTQAEISCLKYPAAAAETALFVTHSPHGRLKPHVRHYLDSLKRHGIAVILIVAADKPFTSGNADLLNSVEGLFVRQNQGLDFAAWAHILRTHEELFDISILYLLNDSVLGPTNEDYFGRTLDSVRSSAADLVGLTENYERGWHISSYFLAIKQKALRSQVFREFVDRIVAYTDKQDVIDRFEIRLAPTLQDAGINCEALFPVTDCLNATIFHWKELLESGFPFLKVMTVRDAIPNADTDDWREVLGSQGYDVALAERVLAEVEGVSAGALDKTMNSQTGETETSEIEDDPSIMLAVDNPEIADGRAVRVIHGNLDVSGWALARSQIAAINVSIDGKAVGTAKYGVRRDDVARAFPDFKNSHLSGYALVLRRVAHTGRHRVRVEVRTESGRTRAVEFDVFLKSEPLPVESLRRKVPLAELELTNNILSGLGRQPHFGIILGLAEVNDDRALDATLLSLATQAYQYWRLTIVFKGTAAPPSLMSRLVTEFPQLIDRIRFKAVRNGTNLVQVLTGRAGGRRPDLVTMISAGDVLACDALLQLAVSAGLNRDADFFYGDERRMSPITGEIEAFLKPQWSPDLLLSTNYIGRVWCVRPDLLHRVGATVEEWREFGEYDLVLRCTEAAQRIQHLPQILCERSVQQIDTPAHEREALTRALARRGIAGKLSAGCAPGYYRLRRDLRSGGLVSIIIPTRASRGLVRTCIESIREKTSYPEIEIIIVDDVPEENVDAKQWLRANTDKVVPSAPPFNWSRYNNRGARAASGEFLVFLNDDIEITSPDWLDCLIAHATRPEVGIVGPRLLYPDGRVQHAGMFWVAGAPGARHAFRFADQWDPGYFGLAMTTREVMMVTGACMMVRREWFETIGGFDENHSIVNNDTDLCLRCWAKGSRIVYEPSATLIHHEAASRNALPDEYDHTLFSHQWGKLIAAGDPYYHPNLSRSSDNYAFDEEPIHVINAGHPLFSVEEVRRILIVKVDHVGDFITSIPALNKLKAHFPHAELYLLVAPASKSLVHLVPGVTGVIEFEFFVARSAHGRRQLSQDDLAQLEGRLVPHRFDLAIDLRMHPETRHLLRYTGARWLAGFDRNNQFPWLDIAVEQEHDDTPSITCRSQVGDSLSRLVDAVTLVTNRQRDVLQQRESKPLSGFPWSGRRSTRNGRRLARIGRRLVCVHPGVGDPTRQWPPEHFAALIDLLVSNHDLDVVLIGGRDEADTAAAVLDKIAHKEAVRSLVGTTSLAELPAVIASAVLFVGNNSGPNHIAAGLGIPSVGVYSGVVDARQWGAIGPNAVAVQRQMHCAPCYIGKISDCPRGMACVRELLPDQVYTVCKSMLTIAHGGS